MYFITFSRKAGTDGAEVARRVAQQLGYNFYHTEAIENAAREMGFLKDVQEIDEKVPSLFPMVANDGWILRNLCYSISYEDSRFYGQV